MKLTLPANTLVYQDNPLENSAKSLLKELGSYEVEEISENRIYCHKVDNKAERLWLRLEENSHLEIRNLPQ